MELGGEILCDSRIFYQTKLSVMGCGERGSIIRLEELRKCNVHKCFIVKLFF